MSAIPDPDTTDSPTGWWDESGAVIWDVWYHTDDEDLDPPENCIFVKTYTTAPHFPSEPPGGMRAVERCVEDDIASGVMYNVGDINPPYAPETKYRRNYKQARRFKCKMINSGTVDINAGDPVTVGPNGRCKLLDATAIAAGARKEGSAERDIPVGKAGILYIND